MKSEKETRASIMNLARQQGVEAQAEKIWNKYEDAVKGAKSEMERHHIAACGLAELHRLIGCVGALVVDGVEIIPEQTGYEDDILLHQPGLVKIP